METITNITPPTATNNNSNHNGVNTHQVTTSIYNYQLGGKLITNRVIRSSTFISGDHKILTGLQADATRRNKGSFKMQPGQLQIWKLRTGHQQDVLSWDGLLALRLVFFDHNLEFIDNILIPKSSAGSIQLPLNAAHMVIKTTEESQGNTLFGWHSGVRLPLLNAKYLMGKSCLIRTQSAIRTGHKQNSHQTGLSRSSKITGKNKVESNEGPEHGWTETMFSATIKEVFVVCRSAHCQPDNLIAVKIIYKDSNGTKYALAVNAASQGQWDKDTWYKFIVPANIPAPFFRVWVQPLNHTKISGVTGAMSPIADMDRAAYQQLAGNAFALRIDNMDEYTVITLDHILNEN